MKSGVILEPTPIGPPIHALSTPWRGMSSTTRPQFTLGTWLIAAVDINTMPAPALLPWCAWNAHPFAAASSWSPR